MNERLIIIGASVRPWIQSARLAGFDVAAFDFFADWDAQQLAADLPAESVNYRLDATSSIQRISNFEELLDRNHEQAFTNCDAAVICGGLESRISLVQELESKIKLLGPSSISLQRVRDMPVVLASLQQAGFEIPPTIRILDRSHDPDKWIKKACGSSGGLGVRMACATDSELTRPGVYFQKKVSGPSASAAFVSFRDQGGSIRTVLLGMTEQTIGDRNVGASEFQYCGSRGPIIYSNELSHQIETVGCFLASEYSMLGLWGVDFVIQDDVALPVDVNPRLTASMALFESSVRRCDSRFRSILDLHVKACRGSLTAQEVCLIEESPSCTNEIVEGQLILFQRHKRDLRISPTTFEELTSKFDIAFYGSNEPGSSIADIPQAGEWIKPGHPVVTLRIRTQSDLVWVRLHEQAEKIYDLLLADQVSE